jgi:hypothetical protein
VGGHVVDCDSDSPPSPSPRRFIMDLLRWRAIGAVLVVTFGLSAPAQASFHLWQIREVFSSADRSVQYMEMFSSSTFNQNFLSGHTIRTTSALNTFTFPTNTGTPTQNKNLLIATAGFGSLPGGVTPDYILPANFFNPTGDTLNFENFSVVTFTNLPTNGVTALQISSTAVQSTATNSPTNFAGTTGSVNVPPPLNGDYNNNGAVDAADYTSYRDTLGTNATLPNDTTPGSVTAADYTVWANNFSAGASAAAVSAVPEPTAIVLAIMSCALLATGQRAGQR